MAEQQANSSRAKSRLQQINFSDQLSGCLIGELACPSHAIEFGPFGAKTGQPQLSFDLVNFAGQHCLFAGFGTAIDPLTIKLHDAYPGVGIGRLAASPISC